MKMGSFGDVVVRVWTSVLETSFAELWKLYSYVVIYC